jgi:glucose/arabinose dehydrogenase
MARSRPLTFGVLTLALLTACSAPDSSSSAAETAAPEPTAASSSSGPEVIASDLAAPWSIVFVDGTPLVSERDSARIVEVAADGATREVGTVPGVRSAGEAGLLGMAVDEANRLYVYSTGQEGNRIERYQLSGTPGSFQLGDPVTLVDGLPAASYHDGGRLAFGPDGMLYATVGDAGRRDSAQDTRSLAGKILRMTPDGEVPEDNPFPGSLVYSYGHRNPQGITWDEDGTMYASEFGQDTWDELNVITPGANYGWPEVEGVADRDEYVDPVQQWTPDQASPSGMTYLDGTLYIANLRGTVLRAVPTGDRGSSTELYEGELGRLRDVAAGPDGRLWLLTSNTDGRGEPGPDDDRLLAVEPSR